MALVFSILWYLCAAASVVCFILVLVMMFQHKQMGLGIACVVLAPCGVGLLLAFILGWMNASEWGTGKIMIAWSAALLLGIIFRIAGSVGSAMAV